jgi:hypothetical protein
MRQLKNSAISRTKKKTLTRFFKGRRLRIIATIFVIILLPATYFAWSKFVWDGVYKGVTEMRRHATSSLDDALKMPSDTLEERERKKAAFVVLANEVASPLADPCTLPSMIGWQRVLDDLGEVEKSCLDQKSKLQVWGLKLQAIGVFLADDKRVAEAASTLQSAKGEVTEADYEANASIWRQAEAAVSGLSVSETFIPVKTTLTQALQAGVGRWDELIDAHKDKDKGRFIGARQAVAASYDGLSKVQEVERVELDKLTQTLLAASKDL